MAKHVKRSVIPIYLVGVVWLVFGLGLRLYQPVDYILCALVSVAAVVVGKAIFPDKSYQIAGGEDEEEKKQAEQEAQKRAEEAHAAREKAQAAAAPGAGGEGPPGPAGQEHRQSGDRQADPGAGAGFK